MRQLGFITDWELSVYGKLCRYFQFIFKELQIPFQTFATIDACGQKMDSQPDTQLLLFLPFDALCRKCDIGLPSMPNVEYIYLITEPDHNLTAAMKFCTPQLSLFYAVLNMNMNQTELTKRLFPDALQFTCFQGYIPTEDIPKETIQTIDVLAPGFAGSSDDRRRFVAQLREHKLNVVDASLFDGELDNALKKTKIAISVPFDTRFNIWYGQRTLWPLNKQACVVTIPSDDVLAEEFYNGLLVNTTRDKFVSTIVDLIRSGKWRELGRVAYERFKTGFYCCDVFDEQFFAFCCEWTNSAQVKT